MGFHEIFDRYTKPLEPVETGLSPSGTPRFPINALLFDIYGTLFISASGDIGLTADSPQIRKALSLLAAEHDLAISSQTLLTAHRCAIEKEHRRLESLGNNSPEVQIDQIWQRILGIKDIHQVRKFALSFELIVNPVFPMPHLIEMLHQITKTDLKTGIISNAQFYTPLLFQYFCGNKPEYIGFDPNLLFYSCKLSHAKPSTLMFKAAEKQLSTYGIHPKNTLFIGNDMLNDIRPAYAHNFQTALFAGDKRSLRLREDDPTCRDIQPDLVITDLLQLPAMIA